MAEGSKATNYDTPLSADQKAQFDAWKSAQIAKGINPDVLTTKNYDLQGWFLKNGPVDLKAGAHFTDQFKKPNHPTFSTESQYSGVDGNVGGEWKQQGSHWAFIAGPANLKNMSEQQLEAYFRTVEPGNILVLPDKAPALYPTMQQGQ